MAYPVPCNDCGAGTGQPCIDGCPSQDRIEAIQDYYEDDDVSREENFVRPSDSLTVPLTVHRTTLSFLTELCNSAAVVIEAIRRGKSVPGYGGLYARGAMRAAAIVISLHHGISTEEVEWEAAQRAKRILEREDYRREISLFANLVEYNRR